MIKIVRPTKLQFVIVAALLCLMAFPANARNFREALRERAKEIIRENDKKESSSRGSSRKRDDDSEKRSKRSERKSSDRERKKAKESERKRDRDDPDDRERYYRHGGSYLDPNRFSYSSRGYVAAPYFTPHSYYYAPPPVIYLPQPLTRSYFYSEPYQTSRVIYPGHAPRSAHSRDTAVQVQSRLSGLGYYRGAIDGIVGGGTRRAIRAFQIDYGLPVSGRIDAPLLQSLGIRSLSL